MQHVFIIGSKGIPGAYGGYETFVDKLTEYHQYSTDLKYHVACKSTETGEFEYHNARCFNIKVPNIGPAQAIYYDVVAVNSCLKYIEKNNIEKPIIYILACRVGPFMKLIRKKIHRYGGKLFINPDGHEWKRAKWSLPVRKYWKLSEKLMVKHADLVICDSRNIEAYIHKAYSQFSPMTTYIAYGAEVRKSNISDEGEKIVDWYRKKSLSSKSYYLVVGRFVPENNYETMIREFMLSNTKRDLAIITNVSDGFLNHLKDRTCYDKDPRIKFVGTVYDHELLMKIRENAYAYLHGHEVGGTNPSLLEALASTNLNLLLDVGFNNEVGLDSALYWNKNYGNLARTIDITETLDKDEINKYGEKSTSRIEDEFSWSHIVGKYASIFCQNLISRRRL